MFIKKPILFIVLCLASFFSTAQDVVKMGSIGVSANSYRGDLNKSFQKWASSVHLSLHFNKKRKFNGTLNLSIGKVTGNNYNYSFSSNETPAPVPNKFFRSTLITFNYDLHYNIIKERNFILYVSQGAGLVRFTPQTADGENLFNLNNTRAKGETYGNISVIFPTYLGAIYLFKNNFGLGFQAGYLNPLTDYIDNISKLSYDKRNDNVLMFKFAFVVPLKVVSNE